MVAFSTTLATTASSFLEFASISFFSANFFSTSFLYSSKVSNSETSDANSSFNSGSSFTLISLTVTLKVAGFPARSAAWYSVGKVTFTSHSSPIFLPISCSSKVSIKEGNRWLMDSPQPFRLQSPWPSTNPSKSITVWITVFYSTVFNSKQSCVLLLNLL